LGLKPRIQLLGLLERLLLAAHLPKHLVDLLVRQLQCAPRRIGRQLGLAQLLQADKVRDGRLDRLGRREDTVVLENDALAFGPERLADPLALLVREDYAAKVVVQLDCAGVLRSLCLSAQET